MNDFILMYLEPAVVPPPPPPKGSSLMNSYLSPGE